MAIEVVEAPEPKLIEWRDRYRAATPGQIVHDSLHRRAGWTESHLVVVDGEEVGYGSIAVAGPWCGRPTVFEFFLAPASRWRAFELFEAYLAASGARFFEVQTSSTLLTVMLHVYGREISSEKIVFEEAAATTLPAHGAKLRRETSEAADRECSLQRQGGSEWALDLDGVQIGRGGIMFHYNVPYADIYMEVTEGSRRRGYGAFFVQELKRIAHEMDAIPCARCSPGHVASRRTLQKAGFVPCGHILLATVASTPASVEG